MGWFDFLKRPDPSAAWPLARRFFPELNLASRSLGPVALGDDPAALRALGKPDNPRPFDSRTFLYRQSGVAVTAQDGPIATFGVALEDDALDGLQAARLRVIRADRVALEVSCATLADELGRFLGRAPERDRDDEEIVDTYRLGNLVVETEARLDGRIKRLNVYPD